LPLKPVQPALLSSGLPVAVGQQERISRFVVYERWFNAQLLYIKAAAFLPDRDRVTSIFRTTNVSEEDIWQIGTTVAATRQGGSLHARGDLPASDIRSANLDVTAAEPPARHGLITGWSQEKDGQKYVAVQLAAAAKLIISPARQS